MTQIATSNGLIEQDVIKAIARTYGLSAAAFALTFRTVAMPQPHTEPEFMSCILVAREHGLNPLTKEIYFMRTKAGAIQAIVSVDGWIKKCNEHPSFDGLEIADATDAKGNVVSMTISIYRKDRSRPTTLTEYMDECAASGGAVWKTSPKRMLRNRVICQGSRVAFGFAGLMAPDEFEAWQTAESVRDSIPPDPDDIVATDPAAASIKTDGPQQMASDAEPSSPDAIVDDPPLPDAEAQRAIANLRDELENVTDEPIRLEIWENYASLFDRMSDRMRRQAEAVFDGRL